MEPLTMIATAIISTLSLGLSQVGTSAITDAYNALKTLIKKKLGEQSKVVTSVQHLEADPNEELYQRKVQKELASAKVDQYPEIVKAATTLLEQLQAQPGGKEHIAQTQSAVGNYNIQVQGSGNTVQQNRG
jgi:hypothetical protein